ncbi:hypothetical protein AVEN_168114-1 [Araneus ventricosus]|uniref:Uncharacterized protein n=1 Tax=Araneus ventricosus TaxID=182803 RepID=A0A4Y2QVH7_ARAVE|nr:hypothetical protein AVEN_168114-1 [Araneus ventricosus]
MSFIRKDSGESTVELENIAHEEEEEDIDESEELIEYLGKALDLEFEVGIATDAMTNTRITDRTTQHVETNCCDPSRSATTQTGISVGALLGRQHHRQKDTSGPFAVSHVNLTPTLPLGFPASLDSALRKRSFSLRIRNSTD